MFPSRCDAYGRDRVAELSVTLCAVLLVTGFLLNGGYDFGVLCERERCCDEDRRQEDVRFEGTAGRSDNNDEDERTFLMISAVLKESDHNPTCALSG